MTYDPQRPPAGAGNVDDLQFDRAETAAPPPPAGVGEPIPAGSTPPLTGAPGAPSLPGVTVCAACREPIADVYFEGNGKVVCPRCRDAVNAAQTGGSAVARLFKATVFGIFAGIVGATIWWAIAYFFNAQLGYVAVAVGLLVGGAVKAGADRRGGIGYQLLAVVLTYLSIAASYIPFIVEHYRQDPEVAGKTVLLVIVTVIEAIVHPVLGGVMGWIILGIALWFAWKINRPTAIRFNGPYRLAGSATVPVRAPAFGYAQPPGYGPPPPMGRA